MNLMISINLTWKLYLLPSTQEKESSKQPASQHYIFQYKMQSIVPNTFTNKESVAQEDSLNNQLKKLIYLYNLNYFQGGLFIPFPHYAKLLEGVEQVEQTHHGSPPKLEDDMGRLADWRSHRTRSQLCGRNFPTVFFCVKKMHPMFFCCMMSCHETICKIKQHDIRIEFQFFHNKQHPYIHPSAMVRSVLFVALCENDW